MSKTILSTLPVEIKALYDFIPYANWDNSEKGERPAPYKLKQQYPESDPIWTTANDDRVGIRLNNMILVDYDGNKPEAVSEIPSVQELATALGFDSAQDLFDKSLIQWNDCLTSLHFMFLAPPEFNVTDFKQSNQGTKEFFWKHIDIKTYNQLVYLKQGKHTKLIDPNSYLPAPAIVIDQLRDKAIKTLAVDFNNTIPCTDHQIQLAETWLHEACVEMSNTADGNRNGTLNVLGCTVAGLIAGGALDNQASYVLLYEAAIASGSDHTESINTLNSAWNEGFSTPRRDAPYSKQIQPISEVFKEHVIHNSNIDTKADKALTEGIEQGLINPLDPNAGILHEQYTYFRENWCMDAKGHYLNVQTLSDLGKSAFNAKHMGRMPVKAGSKSFKKFVPSEVFDDCNPNIVETTMYKPDDVPLCNYEGIDYLNSYIEYKPERPPQADIDRIAQLIYAHLTWLLKDTSHQSYILDWLAWQVQRTGKLIGWVPLLMGCRGDGKSILFELVTSAIGSRNTKMMGNKSAKSDFQDWAVGSAVCAFEEIKVEGAQSKQVANDMKQFITEERVNVNPKGAKERPLPNFTNYIAFSNESDPITIAPTDRRWLVLETLHFGKNSVTDRTQTDMKQHFDDIKGAVRNKEHFPAIHWMLKDHVISEQFIRDYTGRAPTTIFGADLNEQTASERELRLQEWLNNSTFVDGRQGRLIDNDYGFQVQDFLPMMPDNWFAHSDKKPSSIAIGKMLRSLGYENLTRRLPDNKFIKSYKKL